MIKKSVDEAVQINSITVPIFGYELIREDLLNEILGDDAESILYWAGKRLARKYPLFSINEVKEFFINAAWGHLNVIAEKKNEIIFSLTSELISRRLSTKTDACFQLEAGFLAEQIQNMKKVYAEGYEHPKKKDGVIIFTIRWDNIPFNE